MMREVGRTVSRRITTVWVVTLLNAWSVTVPVTSVPVVSWLRVNSVVTVAGPVTGLPTGVAVPAKPRLAVPVATQPACAIPASWSKQVNVVVTVSTYQPLLPIVPLTTQPIVGRVLST